jgi:protein-disulfide isomerase
MRHLFLVIGFVATLFLGLSTARADDTVKLAEHALGRANAPVVIDEFASLTCSHCADFFQNVLPELRTRYIDTGKVRFVFNDYPLDAVALRASALASCMPPDQYFAFISILYRNLRTWVLSPKPEGPLSQYARLGGLSDERAGFCLRDDRVFDALVRARSEASEKYDINSTPTFVINKGEDVIVGAQGLDAFTTSIDRALANRRR